jgi:hypothetical protein
LRLRMLCDFSTGSLDRVGRATYRAKTTTEKY